LYKHFGLTAESVAKTVRQCIWKIEPRKHSTVKAEKKF
jgi:hypothetical protein